MIKNISIDCAPARLTDDNWLRGMAAKKCQILPAQISELVLTRRSIDARGKQPRFQLQFNVYTGETPRRESKLTSKLKHVTAERRVLIVGAGPAGYFAAMQLLEHGIKPVIFERGKDVQTRRKDLRAIQQLSTVDPDSNYCFGEGGAGTYSDGKLYTSAKKRGSIEKILKLLVEHGAPPDILFDAHPHIGSNKLPEVIKAIRGTILSHGGEIHFNAKVTDFVLKDGEMIGVQVNEKDEHLGDAVILATGHSARDIFAMLQEKNIRTEAKPFAMGIRIEHPQALIDEIQYSQNPRHENLTAATYKLVTHVDGRGVFSFCMCPGGLIVPAATAPGELVVNGMSMAKRDSRFANSGIVVAIEPGDLEYMKTFGEQRCLEFQRQIEQNIFSAGDGSQKAPAQRMTDFVEKKSSETLNDVSYIPGIYSAPMHELLPKMINRRLRVALRQFGKKLRGYFTEEANVVGLESRTSSPVRIPRHKETCEHVEIRKLYPCGEGAGYAGGIISAALDGQRVADCIAKKFV